MNISSATPSTTTAPMANAVKQLKVISEMQMEMLKALVESQVQMTQLLQSEGIGLNLDISA